MHAGLYVIRRASATAGCTMSRHCLHLSHMLYSRQELKFSSHREHQHLHNRITFPFAFPPHLSIALASRIHNVAKAVADLVAALAVFAAIIATFATNATTVIPANPLEFGN